MSNNKQYFRDIQPGDVSVEGRQANGITADNDGNVFLYSGLNNGELQNLDQQNYNGYVGINGNINSFLGVIKNKPQENLVLGNNNYEIYNDQKTTDPNKIVTASQPTITPTSTPLPSQTVTPTPAPTSIPSKESAPPPPAPNIEGGFIFLDETTYAVEPTQLTGIIEVDLNNNEAFTEDDVKQLNKKANDIRKQEGKPPLPPEKESKKTGTIKSLIQNNTTQYGDLGDLVYYPSPLYAQNDSEWGNFKSGKLNMSSYGCAYNTACMLLGNSIKDATKTTPYNIWNSGVNGTKSVSVYWSSLAQVVGKTFTLKQGSITAIDEVLKTKPVGFEWRGGNEFPNGWGWDAGYNSYRGKKKGKASVATKGESYTCCNQHWMVITGKNKDGTYTVFNPSGGVIQKSQTAEHIKAGLNRIIYVN